MRQRWTWWRQRIADLLGYGSLGMLSAKGEHLFEFHDPGKLIDGDLELVLLDTHPGDPVLRWVPTYRFQMTLLGQNDLVGRIDLRMGNTEHILMYAGHIGYGVESAYRGHHYAARACRLLMALARSHGLQELWITCNPDNIASRRTCELAGAEFMEIVDLPKDTDMYMRGERKKCRYRLEL
jgi:predicted acetyltransferase